MKRLVGTAAAGCLSGIVLFLDLGFHLFGGLDQGYFVLATVMALGLLGTPAAPWVSGSFAPGRGRMPGVVGTGLVVAGALLWVAAFVLLLVEPTAAFTQRLTPGGSTVMALGMVLCWALCGYAAATQPPSLAQPADTRLATSDTRSTRTTSHAR